MLLSSKGKPLRSDNTSGHPGVTKINGKWVAKITRSGITYYLGESNDFAKALELRIAAEEELKTDPESFMKNYRSLRKRLQESKEATPDLSVIMDSAGSDT